MKHTAQHHHITDRRINNLQTWTGGWYRGLNHSPHHQHQQQNTMIQSRTRSKNVALAREQPHSCSVCAGHHCLCCKTQEGSMQGHLQPTPSKRLPATLWGMKATCFSSFCRVPKVGSLQAASKEQCRPSSSWKHLRKPNGACCRCMHRIGAKHACAPADTAST